jgi:glycosyltransferase involved in cell wall biosynthesis
VDFQLQILVLSGVQGDTRRYRTHHLYEQLRLAGAACSLSHITTPNLFELANRCNLLILHRVMADRVSLRLIESLKKRGIPILLDVDDLVFDPQVFQWIDSPDFADPVRARLYQENIRRSRDVLDASDAVLASTGFLAERVRALGKAVWVHRNGFSLEMMALSQLAFQNRTAGEQDTGVLIGYASGTRTHDQDFALVRPALQEALKAHPTARLWLLGRLDPGQDWGVLADRIRRVPFMPWRQLPALLACLDINLAPLRTDNPFSQSKSEIKYMEAGMVGAPTIASPTDAFAHAIHPAENGLLAGSAPEWRAGLEAWLADPFLRLSAAENARQDILAHFSPWSRALELRATLQEIGQHLNLDFRLPGLPAPASGAPEAFSELWMSAEMECHPTLLERGLYSLRSRGPRTLGGEVWVYLRRLFEPIFPFRPG